MCHIVVGVVAHVDAGKTSTIEAILNKHNILDFDSSEKRHGITISTKMARYHIEEDEYIFLDSPGHRDFSLELERTLKVVDTVLLIVDGSDKSFAYLNSTINMIRYYEKPIIIGVNKIDISHNSKDLIIHHLNDLGLNAIEFNKDFIENVSCLSDELLNEYESNQSLSQELLLNNLSLYQPTVFYSAIKGQNIDSLIKMIQFFSFFKPQDINYQVFKISHDKKGNRLTFLRIYNEKLKLKEVLGKEKINEIRAYHLNTYQNIDLAQKGDLVALTGIKEINVQNDKSLLKPYLQYEIISEINAKEVFDKIRAINEEEPLFKIRLEDNHLYVNLMGELSKTVLEEILKDRYLLNVHLEERSIQLFEAIKDDGFGYAHIERKGSYAEVHVKVSRSDSPSLEMVDNLIEDTFDSFKSNSIKLYGHYSKPLIKTKIEVINLKTNFNTHLSDLKEAFLVAVNDALNRVGTVLLEPYARAIIKDYRPQYLIYLNKFQCDYELNGCLKATIPYRILKEWLKNDQFDFELDDYKILKEDLSLEKQVLNATSVKFNKCYQGQEVMDILDIEIIKTKTFIPSKVKISDEELKKVFNKAHAIKERSYQKMKPVKNENYVSSYTIKPKLMMVDAYNLIHFFPFSYDVSKDLYNARYDIISILKEYQALKGIKMVVVFDAYNKGGSKFSDKDFDIIYTSENETADMYIERECKKYLKDNQVVVVSSDKAIQVSAFQSGASRMSARAFVLEYESLKKKYLKGQC